MKRTSVPFLSSCLFPGIIIAVTAVAWAQSGVPTTLSPAVVPTSFTSTPPGGTSTGTGTSRPPPPPAATPSGPAYSERAIGTPRIVTRTFKTNKDTCMRNLVGNRGEAGSDIWKCNVTYPMPGNAFKFTDVYTTKDQTMPAWDHDNFVSGAPIPTFYFEAMPNGVSIELRAARTANGGVILVNGADARKRFEYQFQKTQLATADFNITLMVVP